jgi:purine-binding chemotaxis protein CheW
MTDTLNSFLTFRLGDELFAANVGKVIEILEVPKITKVPRSPDFMRGVVNLRGNVLSVIDSRTKFGLPPITDTINTCIIVMVVNVDGQQVTLGVIVDAVQEVMEIDDSQTQEMPSIGSRYKAEFIEGMVKRDDHFIMLLNIDALFSSDEVSILNDIASTVTEGSTAKK